LRAEELSDPATSSVATVESAPPVTQAEPLVSDTEPVLELATPDPEASEAAPRSVAPFPPQSNAPVALATPTAEVVERPAGMCVDPQGFLTERGLASWYGDEFAGRLTASGETYDPSGLSVAHLTFPFGALVEVRNLDNGRRILARVNDRGPYVQHRIVDCSLGAAYALGFVGRGVARVSVKLLDAQADVSLIAARRPPALVEDAAPPIPSAHAFADRLALGSGRTSVVAHAAQSHPASLEKLELRRASVLPFPILVHAWRWIANAIVGPRGEEGTVRQRRQLQDATGLRNILRFCLR
jgi:rare lipoprotein A